jgi:hypothetical protein
MYRIRSNPRRNGTWYFGGQSYLGPSHSGVTVYYGTQAETLCNKDHQWPDEQVGLEAYTGTINHNWDGPDCHIYRHDCNEIPSLVSTIDDQTHLAQWSDQIGTIQLSFLPYHVRHLTPAYWGDGTFLDFFFSSNQNNAYFDIEYLYSY